MFKNAVVCLRVSGKGLCLTTSLCKRKFTFAPVNTV